MNYIELINRFWSIDLEVSFSHLETRLYFKLLEINNRLGWKNDFRFPNSRLEAEVGTRPKNLIAARQRLVDLGLIRYKKGSTRNAGTYQLLSDCESFEGTKESNEESNSLETPTKESNKESNQGNNEKVIKGSLKKQNQTKQNSLFKKEKKESFDFVDTVYKPFVDEFIQYRKKLGKSIKTERPVKQFYAKLKDLSGNNVATARKLMDQMMDNEWLTVFPLRKSNSTSQKKEKFRNESVTEYTTSL